MRMEQREVEEEKKAMVFVQGASVYVGGKSLENIANGEATAAGASSRFTCFTRISHFDSYNLVVSHFFLHFYRVRYFVDLGSGATRTYYLMVRRPEIVTNNK